MIEAPCGAPLFVRETDRKRAKRQPTPDTSQHCATQPFTHRHVSDLLNSAFANLTSLAKELINLSKETGDLEPTISTDEIQLLAHAAILPNGSPFDSRF